MAPQRKRVRRFLLWLGLLVIIIAAAVFVVPLPPHGRFSTPQIANTADAYFELADGKLTQVVFTGETGRSGEERRHVTGDYRREHGRWMLVTQSGSTAQLRATLLALERIETNGSRGGPWYRMLR